MNTAAAPKKIAVIGGGPAGLMAAQTAAEQGAEVHVYERKASVGRKFLIAGRGGLNLTHAEPMADFSTRFRDRSASVSAWLTGFDNTAVREWAHQLGIATFVGSSGRVFPTDMKAAPLLRAWLKHLRALGVHFHVNHRAVAFVDDRQLRLQAAEGEIIVRADAFILALGGASWPQLGSDGSWRDGLFPEGLDIVPLQAANCGFEAVWSEFFKDKFAGTPLKPLRMRLAGSGTEGVQGECIISEYGIEGSLVYALSADIRETIARDGRCTLLLDLLPDHDSARIVAAAGKPRNGRSLSDFLRRHFKLSGVKTALLYELTDRQQLADPQALARLLKALPLTVSAPRPMAEAISTAGGVALPQLDDRLMWRRHPGLFFAGEMLDWEAPTGGYLLTASMASGRCAALGALDSPAG
ncbi:TIGR03862 family flavoprotein [Arenimonas sp. GDDSR-1]|uniref:TIGR03862 family flavoprotein n=1 Tax=Arenimonas sp. GDDSR-1 TaxID=2950125 RepID=UPI00261FE6B5|nr:TIGR03862 family flavoprotein [Arenimonas sp. GDDSR-1]